ncbi:unnamed protein product, partial [marine sediment metagenome]
MKNKMDTSALIANLDSDVNPTPSQVSPTSLPASQVSPKKHN